MKEYDYCILGAGLAGLSVAKGITDHKKSNLLILDPNGIAGGASGSPIGLANPATGRYANKSWEAEASIQATLNNLRDASINTDNKFFRQNGVIRPALDSKIAERMKTNIEESQWSPDLCSWVDKTELETNFPNLKYVEGGVWVKCGITVSIPEYLNALASFITADSNTYILENASFDLDYDNHSWIVTFEDHTKAKCKMLIVTAGIHSKDYDFFSELPLTPVKGQVLMMKCDHQFPYNQAVSAGGYFASLDGKSFVAGSTYEHRFEHTKPDEYGEEYILKRLLKVMPDLKNKVHIIGKWAGVRASTPDRLPILDYHPSIKNCMVLTGLGSKGLLYSSLLGNKVGAHLTKGEKLPNNLALTRFL